MKLLVSVRNCEEARIVASCNVPVIDLKEPSAGPLGQASRENALAVSDAVHGRAVLSLAMGELIDYLPHNLDYLQHFDFVKIGLSRVTDKLNLRARWQLWTSDKEIKQRAVVVAYADYRTSQSMEPRQLAQHAVDVEAPYFLIDTWSKSGRGLLDWITIIELQEIIQLLSTNNVGVVLAGSLDAHSINRLLDLPVAMIAVRGAVCVSGNRTASIDPRRIAALLKIIEHHHGRA